MRSKTIYVNLERLYNAGNIEASLILRLMLACNDISLANHYSGKALTEPLKKTQEHIRIGARLYFVRLQAGHLNEAICLIDELSKALTTSSKLRSIYESCFPQNKADFVKLKECLKGGANHKDFMTNVHMLRNKVAFHYHEDRLFEQAIAYRKNNPQAGINSSLTVSNDIRYLRFNIADEIINTVVCRLLWKISDKDKTAQEEADKRANFCFDLCRAFVNFSCEFAFRYVKEHGGKS